MKNNSDTSNPTPDSWDGITFDITFILLTLSVYFAAMYLLSGSILVTVNLTGTPVDDPNGASYLSQTEYSIDTYKELTSTGNIFNSEGVSFTYHIPSEQPEIYDTIDKVTNYNRKQQPDFLKKLDGKQYIEVDGKYYEYEITKTPFEQHYATMFIENGSMVFISIIVVRRMFLLMSTRTIEQEQEQ